MAEAFAPAGISNFFTIVDAGTRPDVGEDLSKVGAKGGGFVLSKGVTSKATVINREGHGSVSVIVDGDPNYDAATTRMAIALLIKETGSDFGSILLEQHTEVPIGHGFGASAASSLSGVYAVARALELKLPKERLAYFAHVAEIISKTGLGTVSAIYDSVGAGAIIEAGGPGVARFLTVDFPAKIKVVTASLAPFQKAKALSSGKMKAKINRLGNAALASFLADPTYETLARAGESFASGLGLMTPELRKLQLLAKSEGAEFASQNMIGYAIHALVDNEDAGRVAKALSSSPLGPRVDIFELGRRKAGPFSFAEVSYPTVTSSFV